MVPVRWLRLGAVLLLVLLLYFVAPAEARINPETVLRLGGALLIFAILAFGMVRQLRMHLDDTSRGIDGLVVGIELVVVVFAYAFFVLDRSDPDQIAGLHTRLDSLYFAMSTLTTIGTGDIHAEGQTARALVLVQMVFNVLFVATAATLLSSRVRVAAQARSAGRRTRPESD